MNENPLEALQPSNDDAGNNSPPAPVEPPAPPPPAPPADNRDAADQITEEEKAENEEWGKAVDDLFPGLRSANDKKGDDSEQGKSEKGAQDEAAQGQAAKDQKSSEGQGDGKQPQSKKQTDENAGADADADADDADDADEEDATDEPADAISRLDARQQQAAVDSIKSEVREKMFKDVPTKLQSGDGEVLDSVDKVMQFKNPATGEPFTREEATLWLANAERDLEKNIQEVNSQIDHITDINLNIKDEADIINYQYGELLRAMPELRAKLWAEYDKSLTKDPKTGIITGTTISLRSLYETALEPYAEMGRRLETQGDTTDQKLPVDPKVDEDAKAKAEQAKQQRRQDRSPIYGGGKIDDASDEDNEWDAAGKAVFGDQLTR